MINEIDQLLECEIWQKFILDWYKVWKDKLLLKIYHTQLHKYTHEIVTEMQISQSFYIVADVLMFHTYLGTIRKLLWTVIANT